MCKANGLMTRLRNEQHTSAWLCRRVGSVVRRRGCKVLREPNPSGQRWFMWGFATTSIYVPPKKFQFRGYGLTSASYQLLAPSNIVEQRWCVFATPVFTGTGKATLTPWGSACSQRIGANAVYTTEGLSRRYDHIAIVEC